MNSRSVIGLASALECFIVAFPVQAQRDSEPTDIPAIVSMGQPPRWLPYTSGVGAFGRDDGAVAGLALGVYRPIGSPVNGVLGWALEGTAFFGGEQFTGGARVLGVARVVNLGYGIDWDARQRNFAFMLSFNTAVRRGGIFGHGTMLRIDWIPPRGNSLNVGITLPLNQRYVGRTRPRNTGVWLSSVVPPAALTDERRADVRELGKNGDGLTSAAAIRSQLANVREAGRLIALYMNFFSEKQIADREEDIASFRRSAQRVRDSLAMKSAAFPAGRDFASAQSVYAASLERAFGLAAGDSSEGNAIAARARAGLLNELLIPYDALFCAVKNHQTDLSPLIQAVRADFSSWLIDSSAVRPENRGAVVRAHRDWLEGIAEIHIGLVKQWSDSRRVWLPLQLALTPDQFDDQREIDSLLERLVAQPFTYGNRLTYLTDSRVQIEIARSIFAARDYHVLWLHDYAGTRRGKEVDMVGFAQTANVYFPALTRAVERYDSTGTLTTYLLFLDQNFYEPNNGRLWMTILEDPLGAAIKLPGGNDSLERILRGRQADLRRAVAQSNRLQQLAARRGGESWLRQVVKVHVNITQPSDFTFRSHRIIPPVPGLPDNLMRDHRKIAFYDVNAAEPQRGAMILSGVGIGEHYSSPTWDDRGILVSGPAVVQVREEARRLLRLNNFRDAEIPPPLRARTPCVEVECAAKVHLPGEGMADSTLGLGRAMQVHNEPGFGLKRASIARALLYTLAPRGSVIVVPDGLWLGSAWAGMLAGSALRGVKVYLIGPAIENAPSPGFMQMSRTQDVMLRLLLVRQEFASEIHAIGGELRIGLFTEKHDVTDVAAQAAGIRAGIDRYPWLRSLIPLAPEAIAVIDSAPAALARIGYKPFALGKDEKPRLPQLHRKTQLVGDLQTIARLAGRPEWRDLLGVEILSRVEQARRGTATGMLDDTVTTARVVAMHKLLNGYYADRPAKDSARMSMYFTIGTQNQDPRGMMMDGEAVFVVSGMSAAYGLLDMYSLMARSTWIETVAELDQLLPPYSTFKRRLGRFARYVL